MASIIRIKRSTGTSAPASLKSGELAYSYGAGVSGNSGDRLFFGSGDNGTGDATSVVTIGGKYFADMLDHTPGTLTASSALIVDVDKKLDELLVDDLSLNGNTVSATGANNLKLQAGSTNVIQLATNNYIVGGSFDGGQLHLAVNTELKHLRTGQVRLVVGDGGTESYAASLNNNGSFTVPGTINTTPGSDANLTLSPNGTGKVSIKGAYTLPSADGTMGYVLTTDGMGSVTFQQTAGSLSFGGDTGSGTISLTTETFGVLGGTGITTSASGNDITVDLDNTAVTSGTYGSGTKSATFTVDAQGRITSASDTDIASTLNVDGNTGSGAIDLLTETLTITGDGAISTAMSGNTLTVSAADATTTTKGVASFASADFSVTGAEVTISNVNLGTQTSGNYVQTIADSGGSNITVNNSGTESADVTLDLTDTTVIAGTYGDGSNVAQITVDAKGRITGASNVSVATALDIAGDTGTDEVNLLTDTLQFTGGEGIDIAVTDNTVTISGEDASDTNKGIASFNTASFTVTAGDVTVKAGGITNAQLEHDSITIGSTEITLGDLATTTIEDLTSVEIGTLTISASEIASTAGISLAPAAGNHISANDARIEDVADPEQPTDAANKRYVDGAVTGLSWKHAANLLATALSVPATSGNVALTGSTGTLVIDSHPALNSSDIGYRIVLTAQTTDSQNGIYEYTEDAGNYTLVRTNDADTFNELEGAAVFILEGTRYGSSAWTQINYTLTNFTTQEWVQFSGANIFEAGAGLDLTGTTFSVNVGPGLEISSDDVQLASTVAGDGLTFDTGVLNVVGTADRISVSANAVDISSTYVGQNTITTLGTITTGVWNGTAIGVAYGGTGLTTYNTGDLLVGFAGSLATLSLGTNGKVLQSNGTTLVYGDVDGGTYP
jgi:hypothetical protein